MHLPVSVTYAKINMFKKHCLTKIKPLHFLYPPIDFLWSSRSCSKAILPMGVVSRARFTPGGKAIGWLRLCFWIAAVIAWGAHRGLAPVPGTLRGRNAVVSGPCNIIGLYYSIAHIHSRIGGNISHKIDIPETCFYAWAMFSRVIFRMHAVYRGKTRKPKGSLNFSVLLNLHCWCWNAAHELLLKKILPSHRRNSAKPRDGSWVGWAKFGPLFLYFLFSCITI